MVINFSYNYFIHPEKDGNLSHGTTEARIADAEKILQAGMQIKFEEDGKVVSSIQELSAAIKLYTPQSKTVTIFGYAEHFAVNPPVDIYNNGILIGEVMHSGKIEIQIEKECELEFRYSLRSARCHVKAGDYVILSFNRKSGHLSAIVASQDNYEEIRLKLQSQDKAINDSVSADLKRTMKKIGAVLFVLIVAVVGVIYIANSDNSGSSYQTSQSNVGNYGGLGNRSAVISNIEYYIPSGYYVAELLECKEVNSTEVEYKCTIRLNATGSSLHKGHGHLIQDASGRNVRGSFAFDD